VRPEALDELVRLAGSLERIDPAEKAASGEWILARIEGEGAAPHLLWSLGRIGARVPFAGSAHLTVPAGTVEGWIARLLASPVPRRDLVFPLAQLARRSGDRARDVAEDVRAAALAALAEGGAAAEALRAVREVAIPSEEEEGRVFGESLPPGLRLVEEDVPRDGAAPAPESPPG
jgi:hypothetical protein